MNSNDIADKVIAAIIKNDSLLFKEFKRFKLADEILNYVKRNTRLGACIWCGSIAKEKHNSDCLYQHWLNLKEGK